MRNITERKHAEAEVQNALEKERELSELKSRFVTTTSHEFRTPLAAISLAVGLLEGYSSKFTQEKRQIYLSRIQTAVQCMTDLLEDVLPLL